MLLVDIGNSRIKWGQWLAGQLQSQDSIEWRIGELERLFHQHWGDLSIPARILVSNVAGQNVAEQMTSWTVRNWAVAPEFVSVKEQAFGVRTGYEDPKQLGVDRWLAMIAVWNRYKTPACIVDCGTAVTIDALSAHGEHLGGLITPGLILMRQSLSKRTYGIRVDSTGRLTMLARNTQDSITAGSFYAVAACIDRVASELRKRFGNALRYFITGGDAESLMPLLVHRFERIPDLVLRGLAVVAEGAQ